ncbi:protein adenylyltransferase SelO [Paenibacillus albus]|uniref:Protein nucleotidyltransferase YdiU n=1 Tax=Paenibacillus albus TaxID=2495582 RepID=A0A3Q8X5R6_9BACL|nr:YdiU family protein [Paenibacillus albus]AZN41164.1 YdiU family protein [Paenibacillus albus]
MSDQQTASEAGWNLDNSYARLPESFYTRMKPMPVRAPKLVVLNEPVAAALGLHADLLRSAEAIAVFAGNDVPAGAEPLAQAYAGHQFGYFNMLGDGRALLISEQITPKGERFDIQLKGSGPTPYSRSGDGRAALGPMLREYIISEAMHALGIPTTRSLAVVTTGQSIIRESELQGAIMTRVAASHLRVGTFQYAAAKGHVEELRELADYTIERHYAKEIADDQNRYLALLEEVIKRQASLIAKWMLVGFIHGVMNTDNMAISGETIDYGPCAFIDAYSLDTVFSSIDREGRYAYGNQPKIAVWNLARFAETLLPLLHSDEEQAVKLAEEALGKFAELYHGHWLAGMRAKLGLFGVEADDEKLIEDLLRIMQQHGADYTNTFRALTFGRLDEIAMSCSAEFAEWFKQWQARLGQQAELPEAVLQLMRDNNPAVIPRNHRVEEALDAAEKRGDYSVMEQLLAALSNPFAHSPEQEAYAELPSQNGRPYRTYCGT